MMRQYISKVILSPHHDSYISLTRWLPDNPRALFVKTARYVFILAMSLL
jgi:hypothetical protein